MFMQNYNTNIESTQSFVIKIPFLHMLIFIGGHMVSVETTAARHFITSAPNEHYASSFRARVAMQ